MPDPNFEKKAQELERYINEILPAKAEDIVMDSIDDNFDKESYNETEWTPLSEKYAKRKGTGKKILSDTGDLRSGITSDTNKGEVIISADTEYAQYHNEGGSIDGRPPRRQFIPTEDNPDKKLEKDLYDMIHEDLINILKS